MSTSSRILDTDIDFAAVDRSIDELHALARRLHESEGDRATELQTVAPMHAASARNLLHYLALRQHDIRALQERLQSLGLSSLGRAEAHVLGNVYSVLAMLYRIRGEVPPPSALPETTPAFGRGPALLRTRSDDLFGTFPSGRPGRIMVTMPSLAASDPSFVSACLAAGMDCMRINCAHDDAELWTRMIAHLRAAQAHQHRPCRVLMDLGGPKLRTGPIANGPAVLHWRPDRDALGRLRRPAQVWLTRWPAGEAPDREPHAVLRMPAYWLAAMRPGDRVAFEDARGKTRSIRIERAVQASFWGSCERSAYVTPDTRFRLLRRGRSVDAGSGSEVSAYGIAPARGALVVRPGDRLVLTAERRTALPRVPGDVGPCALACVPSEALAAVRPGESVWFDDGKIGGTVRAVRGANLDVEIVVARAAGSKLHADRGINFPDSDLPLPALTARDVEDLPFVAAHADLVGLSWAQSADDVCALHSRLRAAGAGHVGIVLKIETRKGFESLPELLLAAMRGPAIGVMIARGDLAVECGWEQLAEIQEQILWICESAHVPVIWATQVLESLAKHGRPSRAEITDAAMSVRAECVMLNKGPHVVEAIGVLDRILKRMDVHREKHSPRLSKLAAWARYENARPYRTDQGLAPEGGPGAGTLRGGFAAGTSWIASINE